MVRTASTPPIEISLKKTKLFLFFLGGGLFAVAGLLMVMFVALPIVRIIGCLALLFFGSCFLFTFLKMWDGSPGLTITSEVIIDNSDAAAVGKISREDVTHASITQVMNHRFLTLHVRNPEHYISRGNRFQKHLRRMNYKMTGSPVNISGSTLDTKFDEMVRTIEEIFLGDGHSVHQSEH